MTDFSSAGSAIAEALESNFNFAGSYSDSVSVCLETYVNFYFINDPNRKHVFEANQV